MSLIYKKYLKKQSPVPKLIITPMMDMFTIIVIFLLFSFSDNPNEISLEKDMQLPKSISDVNYSDSIQLLVSESKLMLDNKIVAKIDNNNIIGLDINRAEESEFYNQLRQYKLNNEQPDMKNRDHILFLCDKHIPFKIMNPIIKTAGKAGFSNFQFAVLQK